MKQFLLLTGLALLLFTCEQEEYTFGELTAPTNLNLATTVVGQTDMLPNGDGTGEVEFVATADNAITYKFIFSDGTEEIVPSGRLTKRFSLVGVNTYDVTIVATGTAGIATTLTSEVTVESTFSDPEVLQFLTGGGSKTWYWAADESGHLGVGANNDDLATNYFAGFYQAAPFEKDGEESSACFYQDELTFRLDGEQLQYEYNNFGQTFFHNSYASVGGGSSTDDSCYDYSVSNSSEVVNLGPSESVVVANGVAGQTRGTNLNFTDGGFMSYYVGSSVYEILSITANRLEVRTVMGNDAGLAWYHTFTTTKPVQGGGDDTDYDNLVWSDEFDVDGAPNTANWSYNTGTGNNGWGNGESQFYTDRPENVIVEDGKLKITARREAFSGSNFTSSRLVTENKFEFTYGRIDISAKLTEGGGTWPALWMLGEDYATNTWPGCGEIDIMEHVGNQQNRIFSSLHLPGNSGGNAITEGTQREDVANTFHKYSAIWSPESIRFFVDDELYHTFSNSSNVPFNSDFFLIFNVAMGGGFGGDIDPAFTESTMEVEYVRVFQ